MCVGKGKDIVAWFAWGKYLAIARAKVGQVLQTPFQLQQHIARDTNPVGAGMKRGLSSFLEFWHILKMDFSHFVMNGFFFFDRAVIHHSKLFLPSFLPVVQLTSSLCCLALQL